MIKCLIIATMLAALTVLTGGCASKNDSDMSLNESRELIALAQAEETRTENIEEVHNKSVNTIAALPDTTGPVKILGIALVSRDTADALVSELPDILKAYSRSTKGTDVQFRAVEGVERVAPVLGMAGVAVVGIKAKTGSVQNVNEGGGTIENVREETHATGFDGSSPSVDSKNPVTTEASEPAVSD